MHKLLSPIFASAILVRPFSERSVVFLISGLDLLIHNIQIPEPHSVMRSSSSYVLKVVISFCNNVCNNAILFIQIYHHLSHELSSRHTHPEASEVYCSHSTIMYACNTSGKEIAVQVLL